MLTCELITISVMCWHPGSNVVFLTTVLTRSTLTKASRWYASFILSPSSYHHWCWTNTVPALNLKRDLFFWLESDWVLPVQDPVHCTRGSDGFWMVSVCFNWMNCNQCKQTKPKNQFWAFPAGDKIFAFNVAIVCSYQRNLPCSVLFWKVWVMCLSFLECTVLVE